MPHLPTVTLHCKPYVSHWIKRQYGHPVKLPRRSGFKHTFLSCLTKKFHACGEYDIRTYPAQVEFELHIHDLVQHGKCIQKQLHHHINTVFEEQIKNELFMYIFAHHIKGMSLQKAALVYQTTFGYNEDLFPIATILIAYHRKKKEFEHIFSGTDTKTKQYASANA